MRSGLNLPLVLARDELSCRQRDEMFRLLGEHFLGVSRDRFEQDLADKNWVIVITRASRIVGFSTLLAYETTFAEAPVSVIYSGDTIMAREAWGSTALPRAWIETVTRLRATYSRGPFYWLLLTSGFRTYRFLSVFWRTFWPRFNSAPAPWPRSLVHHLAAERFGNQYDPARGIVRLQHPQTLLPALAEVPAGRIADPHVAVFLARNPGRAGGDELVCLTELSSENLTPAGQRMASAEPHEVSTGHC